MYENFSLSPNCPLNSCRFIDNMEKKTELVKNLAVYLAGHLYKERCNLIYL